MGTTAGTGIAGTAGIAGDPAGVEAAAQTLDGAGRDLTTLAESLGSRSRRLGSAWSGTAATAATTAVDQLGRRATAGAAPLSKAGPVLREYARALRAAQADYAAAAAQAATAAQAVTAAAGQQAAADALPMSDLTRPSAQQAASFATNGAAALLSGAHQDMQGAVDQAARANQAAADAITDLTGALEDMSTGTTSSRTNGGRGADAGPAYQMGWSPAHQAWNAVEDWWSTTVHDAVGGLYNGLWESSVGMLGQVLARSPLPGDQETSQQITRAHDWLEHEYGADTTSRAYDWGDQGGQALAMVIGPKGGRGGRGGEEVPNEGATAGDTKGGDSTGGGSGKNSSGASKSLADIDPPDTRTSPRADLYRDYQPWPGTTKEQFKVEYWNPGARNGGGDWRWPDGPQGFDPHTPREANTLQPGQRIDRFGAASGNFAAPLNTPFAERGLPPSSVEFKYGIYEVLKPLPKDVEQGLAAPAFGQPGGGVQYCFPKGLQYYIDHGYLRPVTSGG